MTRALLALALMAGPVAAQSSQCGPRMVVTKHLAERFGESRQTIAISANGSVIETFANPATGTWTAIATRPSGLSCLLASGEAFEILQETLIPGEDG